MQVMQLEDADPDKFWFDPSDVNKVWPRGQFPMHEFGKLVLNKNPENSHRDVEQAAFLHGSMVPDIEDSRTTASSSACSSTAKRSTTDLASTYTRFLSTARHV